MSASGPLIRVTRRFTQPDERVFDAWLDPAVARRFLFATPMGQMVRFDIDARVGGRFAIVERRGDMAAEHYGEYLEIDRPRRLAFLFSTDHFRTPGDRVTIDIVAGGGGCALTLTHQMKPEWKDYAERTEKGWQRILESLAALL